MNRLPHIVTTIYLLAVATTIVLAFDFEGAIDFNWTVVLIGITLPWSLTSIFFTWTLIHGAYLGEYALMYSVFACTNGYIIFRILSKRAQRLKDKAISHAT